MGATNRELEDVRATRVVQVSHRVMRVIEPALRWLGKRMPRWLSKRLGNTLGGRSGAVFSLIEKERFAEAFALAMEGVTNCETSQSFYDMQKLYWWNFMECSARSATHLGDHERQQVLARFSGSPEPGGLSEAQCLETFARWRWTAGDKEGAIEFARRAVLADPTWPAGQILLAWYGLITGQFDPLPRLREAIRLAPDSLAAIRANPEFARFPDLIAALERPPASTAPGP
jgi:hypothetical protein